MYVKETLPDNSREKGRSSTGSSDTHRNTQHHKSYLDKQLLIEKEKEKESEREREREREREVENRRGGLENSGEEEEEEEEEAVEEYRAGENSNESEVGSAIEFSSSVKSLFSDTESGDQKKRLSSAFDITAYDCRGASSRMLLRMCFRDLFERLHYSTARYINTIFLLS